MIVDKTPASDSETSQETEAPSAFRLAPPLQPRLAALLSTPDFAQQVARNLMIRRGVQLAPWMSAFDIDLMEETLPILDENGEPL